MATDEDELVEQEMKRLKLKQRQVEREARGDNLEFPPEDLWYAEEDDDG